MEHPSSKSYRKGLFPLGRAESCDACADRGPAAARISRAAQDAVFR
jgi:hypothetical protein